MLKVRKVQLSRWLITFLNSEFQRSQMKPWAGLPAVRQTGQIWKRRERGIQSLALTGPGETSASSRPPIVRAAGCARKFSFGRDVLLIITHLLTAVLFQNGTDLAHLCNL